MGRGGLGLALSMMLVLQKGPPTRKVYDPFQDPTVQKGSDDSMLTEQKRRLEAERLLLVTQERQSALARDATELVRMVTELQTSVVSGDAMRKQVEAIEKMARSMKQRAKGEQR